MTAEAEQLSPNQDEEIKSLLDLYFEALETGNQELIRQAYTALEEAEHRRMSSR